MKLLIIEDSNKYSEGLEINSKDCKFISEGLLYNDVFISKKKYITLQEEISKEDLIKISNLFDKKLKLILM